MKGKKKVKVIVTAGVLMGVIGFSLLKLGNHIDQTPKELLEEYFSKIETKGYAEMYSMISKSVMEHVSKDDFIKRNSAIYEGIEVKNVKYEILNDNDENKETVRYHMSYDTVAGNIQFENAAIFVKENDKYKLQWNDGMIFPELSSPDKVKVTAIQAARGEIFDRNGKKLAGQGIGASVGIVPGKLEDRDKSIAKISGLLDMKSDDIEQKLKAKWVTEDCFVPIKTLRHVSELAIISTTPNEEDVKEYNRQKKLLEIPGVQISDVTIREYPLGEAATHLIGYVQSVTAEDLEKHEGEGYTANSVIGKSGMEALFEKQLKGRNGCEIYIADSNGEKKQTLAEIPVQNGQDITLTIDSDLQNELYDEFQDDPGCSVAMNPYTGEVLALVSTPSYDNNDYILGMSSKRWKSLNKDERKPLFNRFRQIWCPGSTFKPVTAVIGLQTRAFGAKEDFGREGLSWQKDSSWGSYHITTLHEYSPVTLKNALIYSDNIYFAKAALKIGNSQMEEYLQKIGFASDFPFEIKMAPSRYSNSAHIDTEVQLADSGYGQGEILLNPLHLASIYTAFLNEGDILKPYLVYEDKAEPKVWIQNVFSKKNTETVLDGLKQVISSKQGTGHGIYRKDVVLAGKTGTAELKATKEDQSGSEIGWFAVMTTEEAIEKPVLIVSMVENVKGLGGSGYVVKKDKRILDAYLAQGEK